MLNDAEPPELPPSVMRRVRILRQLDVVVLLDLRQDLGLDELRVLARDRVVLEAALAAPAVAAAVGDHHRDDRRQPLLGDHVVEDRRQLVVARAVGVARHDQRRGRAGDVLARDVDGDVPRRRRAAQAGVGIELAVGGVHREGLDASLRHAVLRRQLRRGRVLRTDEVIAVAGAGRPRREGFELGDLRGVSLGERRPIPSSGRRCRPGAPARRRRGVCRDSAGVCADCASASDPDINKPANPVRATSMRVVIDDPLLTSGRSSRASTCPRIMACRRPRCHSTTARHVRFRPLTGCDAFDHAWSSRQPVASPEEIRVHE